METDTTNKNNTYKKFLNINVLILIFWIFFTKFVSINIISFPYAGDGAGLGVLMFIALSGVVLCVLSFISLFASISALESLKKRNFNTNLEKVVMITSKSLIGLTAISWILFYYWVYTMFFN